MSKDDRNYFKRCEALIHSRHTETDGSEWIIRLITFVSLMMMAAGFIGMLINNGFPGLPGPPVLSPSGILHSHHASINLTIMSSGILLLALIPSLRVILGLREFVNHKELLNASTATIVLIELLLSIIL